MRAVLLPPGVNPIAVNKYINYQLFSAETCEFLYDWPLVSIYVEDNLYALWSFYSLVQVPLSIDVISSTYTTLYSGNVFTEETDEQVIRPVTLCADTTSIYPHTRKHSLKY
jgi:hypothetical protein